MEKFLEAIKLAFFDFWHDLTCGRKYHGLYYRDGCFPEIKKNRKRSWVYLHEFLKICDNCGREVGSVYEEVQ